ncbi:MAG: hypothetical protein ACYCX4_07960 [Bacillota bacterium]
MSSKAKAVILSVVALLILYIMAKPLFMQSDEVPLHKRVSDYNAALAQAKVAQKPVYLEFYSEY